MPAPKSLSSAQKPVMTEAGTPNCFDARSNVVDVYVRYLREKVDRPFGCSSIQTVRGVGYRFVPTSAGSGRVA